MKTIEQIYKEFDRELEEFKDELFRLKFAHSNLYQANMVLGYKFNKIQDSIDTCMAKIEYLINKSRIKHSEFARRIDRFPRRYRNKLIKKYNFLLVQYYE